MSQDNNVVIFGKRKHLTDKEKVVLAYHAFEKEDIESATRLLSSVSQAYYMGQFHKDLARALLCHATIKITQDPKLGKESEFYLVVYRLTKHIVSRKIHFNQSGHFYQLRDELFKDFNL